MAVRERVRFLYGRPLQAHAVPSLPSRGGKLTPPGATDTMLLCLHAAHLKAVSRAGAMAQ